MVTIGDLPEDVMLEVLSFVPARHLVRSCRLVCLLWRDLVDVSTLWKRKCQREGYHSKRLDPGAQDWKTFYFLCSLKRNLIRNPSAEGLSVSGDEISPRPTPDLHHFLVSQAPSLSGLSSAARIVAL